MSTATAIERRLPSLFEVSRRVVSLAGLVLVWTAISSAGLIGGLPGPVAALTALVALLGNPIIHESIHVSLLHILGSFVVAAAIGIPLGLLIGWKSVVHDLVFPSLEILRPVPPIAWIPLTILVLPSMRSSIMFITFLGAFFPILLNTIRGVHDIESDYTRAIKSLGGTSTDVFRNVIYPGALPSIHTGLVIGMGLAWVNLVAAEMVADEGIGRFVWVSYTSGNYENIVASVILIGALGYASSEVIRLIGRWQLSWTQLEE
ncbi:ABC transporter permease (plasmid) [Haloarcula salina]|uniref:ABC transporter permease n=1 Tax=Haloarcula salina TaxID=1429914 RepID=UPI003C6ED31D